MAKQSVGIVGVSGYTGMELARLLVGHQGFELTRATSRAEAGKQLGDLYPFLRHFPLAELRISQPDPEDLSAACELVFLAVPHGAAMDLAAPLREKGLKVVDLSADFRLRAPDVYHEWYGQAHRQTGILLEAVYGLPELYRERIATAQLLANPGCYPTCSILGLYPALKHKLVATDGIVIDAKSGTSGAGRKASVGTLFCEVQDNFRAYNLGKHRHTPEIEQELSALVGRELRVSFNTHLLPINRGILSTIYCALPQPLDLAAVVDAYREIYKDEFWIRVLPAGQLPELRHVRGTMFCDIGLVVDPRTQRLIIVAAIDNLCRGASGQALANANLMCGLDQRMGLDLPPLVP
jgi:N-acetyl-gamma-glutamyl-phosphate reductase